MNCENCNANFEPQRNSSKFCSPKCRIESFRKRDKSVPLVEIEEITEEIVTVLPKTSIVPCRCHVCGEEVSELICICRKCVESGITHRSLGLDIEKCK